MRPRSVFAARAGVLPADIAPISSESRAAPGNSTQLPAPLTYGRIVLPAGRLSVVQQFGGA